MTNSQSPQTELADERYRDLAEYARAASIALMELSGGGSEMFTRIGDEFYAMPKLCAWRARERNEMCRRLASRPSPLVDTGEALREALEEAREAIASLPEDGLGMAQIAFGTTGVDVYPIRDELIAKIDAALAAHPKPEEG